MGRIPLTIEQAYNKSLSVGIIMIGQYTNQRTKTQFQCPYCNNIFDAQPGDIWRKNTKSCGCYRSNKISIRNKNIEFINKLKKPKKIKQGKSLAEQCPESLKLWDYNKNKITPNTITYGSNDKVWFICLNGHNAYNMCVADFSLHNSRCPRCNESKGERKVIAVLDKYGIQYERQKRFIGCKHKYVLSFDFYLPNHHILIEYNGEQHYNKNNNFGKRDRFVYQQKCDIIKKQYCQDNNIQLIIIPYTNFSKIEEILIEKLKLQNLLNC